eukprot:2558615-Amphidinium_carterae.1
MPTELSRCTASTPGCATHADHGDDVSAYLLVWKQSPAELLRLGTLAHTSPTIYYRRAEDLSLELIPDTESMNEAGVETIAFDQVNASLAQGAWGRGASALVKQAPSVKDEPSPEKVKGKGAGWSPLAVLARDVGNPPNDCGVCNMKETQVTKPDAKNEEKTRICGCSRIALET